MNTPSPRLWSRHASWLGGPWLGWALVLAGACRPWGVQPAQGPTDTRTPTAGTSTAVSPPDPDAAVLLTDSSNYRYQGVLDAPTFQTAAGSDLDLSWGGLSADLQCHDLDPAHEIDQVSLLLFGGLSETEVELGISNDNLDQIDLTGYFNFVTKGRTEARLSDFGFLGSEVEVEGFYTEGSGTWMVLLSEGLSVGIGSRYIAFLEPSSASSTSAVTFSDDCSVLDFDIDLGSLEPVAVGPAGPWPIDWSQLTRDGRDNPLDPAEIDGVMLGHYTALDPSQLESAFLDLELLADGLWTRQLETQIDGLDLTSLTQDGVAFDGFDDEGTWILGLRCSTCPNPAPLYLTVLDVAGAW